MLADVVLRRFLMQLYDDWSVMAVVFVAAVFWIALLREWSNVVEGED